MATPIINNQKKVKTPVSVPASSERPPETSPSEQINPVWEGWPKSWDTALPKADVHWLKDNFERGLFKEVEHYKKRGSSGQVLPRHILKDDRMWFYPPEPPAFVSGGPPNVDAFFRNPVFFWRPVGVWGYSFRCPRKNCPAKDEEAFLYRCGYSKTVRYICNFSSWYCMLTEVLACNACLKAAKKAPNEHHIAQIPAWDWSIVSQLTPAHQALFPAVLTPRRGVDKQVVNLLRDCSLGNTMAKTWSQILENHCEDYLNRKDLYTTLLESINKKGGIIRKLGHKFQQPPPRRELPIAKLLRKAYLIAEAEHVQDYREQIMSTFCAVLKMDSTKKICSKLVRQGGGTAEWCTNIANEHSQILNAVLTCEESVDKLQTMATGLMERYRRCMWTVAAVIKMDQPQWRRCSMSG